MCLRLVSSVCGKLVSQLPKRRQLILSLTISSFCGIIYCSMTHAYCKWHVYPFTCNWIACTCVYIFASVFVIAFQCATHTLSCQSLAGKMLRECHAAVQDISNLTSITIFDWSTNAYLHVVYMCIVLYARCIFICTWMCVCANILYSFGIFNHLVAVCWHLHMGFWSRFKLNLSEMMLRSK